MDKVDVAAAAFGVMEAGLKVQVANDGSPEQVRDVAEANPLAGMMLMVEVAELPFVIVAVAGDSEMAKSGDAVMVMERTLDVEGALFVSPAYVAVRLWVPTVSELVVKVATAPELSVTLASTVVLSRNVT